MVTPVVINKRLACLCVRFKLKNLVLFAYVLRFMVMRSIFNLLPKSSAFSVEWVIVVAATLAITLAAYDRGHLPTLQSPQWQAYNAQLMHSAVATAPQP
jgi:hypothetical protein